MSNTKSLKSVSKLFTSLTVALLFTAFATLPVLAQEATPSNAQTTEGIQQGGMGSIPVEPIVEDKGPQITQEQLQQQFITGIAAGVAIGIVVGGALVWFIKPSEA